MGEINVEKSKTASLDVSSNSNNSVIEVKIEKEPEITEAPSPITPKQKNVLEDFASVNHIFTFAALTGREVSQPKRTYRIKDFEKPILKSGGGLGNRKVQSAYEKNGRIEYFIENVSIDSIIAPTNKTRTTNATLITFDVIEPYSMGLFLQTLQIAATKDNEFNSYLSSPFCLKIDFLGHVDYTTTKSVDATKYFPLKLINIDFSVNGGGSTYSITAIPWTDQALTNVNQTLKTDITITGETLVELLQTGVQSLASEINSKLLEQENAKQIAKADEVIIVFPKDRASENYAYGGKEENDNSATIRNYDPTTVWQSLGQDPNIDPPKDFDAYASRILGFVVRRSKLSESIKENQENGEINNIGKAKMIDGSETAGLQPFGFAKFDYDSENKAWKSGGTTISEKFRTYTFRRGTKIEKIIEELILLSDYGKNLSKAIIDNKEGFINWFRIETRVYPVPNSKASADQGRNPNVYVFRIIPYKVHTANILAPNKPGAGYDKLKEQAAKEYNYIYTGLNKDILDFDITLNNTFFSAVSADAEGFSADTVQSSRNSSKPVEHPIYGPNETSSRVPNENGGRTEFVTETNTGKDGGGASETTETRVARLFHEAIVNSQVDLLTLNVQILGDPFYLADSGIGNYSSEPTSYININANGGINYEDSEVDVIFNFRTPLDYNQNQGTLEFPEDTVPIKAFSGLYKVIQVKNVFEENNFKQELLLIRRRNQDENVDEETANLIASRVQASPAQIAEQQKLLDAETKEIETRINDIDQTGRVRGGL